MSDPHQNEYLSKAISDAPRVRKEAAASATEIRQFINGLRGKSPQEMLGTISASSLVQATVQATVWTTLLLAGFTFIPYLLKSDAKASNKPSATAKKADESKAADKVEKPDTKPAVAASANGEPSADNVQKAAKAMGLDEVKQADSKKNPREKDLDTLLDDLK